MTTINNQQSIVELNQPLFNGLAAIHRAYGAEIVRALASEYHFDAEAAISKFVKEPVIKKQASKPKKAKKEAKPKAEKKAQPTPSVPIPWTGVVRMGLCTGLRLNHGLHTQCTMAPEGDGCFCKTCQKQADASSNGKPTYGTVEDRLKVPMNEYRDPKGKQSVPFVTVMKKLNFSREEAEAAALTLGQTIPDECFAERAVTRGRPKKDASASDSESSVSSGSSAKKRGRGRPKKEKTVVEAATGEDLIAALVAKANTPAALSSAKSKKEKRQPAVALKVLVDGDADSPNAAPHGYAMTAHVQHVTEPAHLRVTTPVFGQSVFASDSPIDSQVQTPDAPKAASPKSDMSEVSRDADWMAEESTQAAAVSVTEVKGVKYFNQEGWLYNTQTKNLVGFWNGSEIEPAEDDDSDDEE